MRYYLLFVFLFIRQTGFSQSVESQHTYKYRWSIVESLIKDSSLQKPFFHIQLAETNRGIFIFANAMFSPKYPTRYSELFDWDKDEPLIAIGPEGKKMPVPSGNHSFSYPRVLADSSGTVHLLWADTSMPLVQSEASNFTTIWYAQFKHGQWSDPNLILKAREINWEPNETSRFYSDSNGVIHLLFITNKKYPDGNGNIRAYTGMMHLYKNKENWHKKFWAGQRSWACPYVDLATNPNNELYMSCIGPDFNTPNDQNSVFFSSSDDNGANWAKSQLISLSGPELKRAIEPQIVYTSGGTIHLVWGQSLDREIFPETFGHAYSHDRGKTWSDVHFLKTNITGSIIKLEMVADEEGNLHLVYTSRANLNEYHTYHRMWNDNHWNPSSEIYPNKNFVIYGELLLKKNGDLLLPVNQYQMTEGFDRGALPVNTFIIAGEKIKE